MSIPFPGEVDPSHLQVLRPPPLTVPTLTGEQIPQEGGHLLSQREALGSALTPNLWPAPRCPSVTGLLVLWSCSPNCSA